MNRREAKKLSGEAWLNSDYRLAWELRVMRRRVRLYKVAIGGLRLLNKLTGGPNRPSLQVTYWDRVGPHGRTYRMPKLETMTGRTDEPVTSPDELRARTSFAARLARTISADEWPQMIEEYERRKRGEAPQYHYVGHRPLNEFSHALMDKAWVKGELPTDEYKAWLELKHNDEGAFFSLFFTHGGARGFAGAEANPDYLRARVEWDLKWQAEASLGLESQVLHKARTLRAQRLVKFVTAEAKHVLTGGRSSRTTAASSTRDVYTPEVVAAVADFTKPVELRTSSARGETEPSIPRAAAAAVANTVARGLPPPIPQATPNQKPAPTPEPATRPPATPAARRPRPGPMGRE